MVARPSKKAERFARAVRDDQLRTVMSTSAGQALIWRLLSSVTGVFGPSFSTDASLAAYTEGQRSIGIMLMREAQRVAPTQYLEMTRERINADLLALAPQKEEPEDDTSGDSSHEC